MKMTSGTKHLRTQLTITMEAILMSTKVMSGILTYLHLLTVELGAGRETSLLGMARDIDKIDNY